MFGTMMQRFSSDRTGSYDRGDDESSYADSASYYTENSFGAAQRDADETDVLHCFHNVTHDSIPEENGEEVDIETFTILAVAEEAEAGEDTEEEVVTRPMPLGLKCFGIALVVVIVVVAAILAVYFAGGRGEHLSRSPDTGVEGAVSEIPDSPTASPTKIAYGYILGILDQYTDVDILTDPTTPQGQAFVALVQAEEAVDEPATPFRVTQRYALATLYYSTKPEGWEINYGWNTFHDAECGWYGVDYTTADDEPPTVTGLDLSSNGLGGSIPEEICLLDSLEELKLGDNFIYALPQCVAGYSNLKTLDVHGNLMSGDLPEGLLTITTLEVVDISNNRFDKTLDVLFVGSNTFPAGLIEFNAQKNWLTGPIPGDFGFLPSLEKLFFQENQFEGPVGESLCNLNTVFLEDGQLVVDCVLDCSCCTLFCE